MTEQQRLPENIEEGVIPEEIVNQMREGHHWGVPLVFMADKIGFKPEVGKSIKMTVLPKKRFPIPSEGAIHYEVKTDPENENKKIFASSDESIGDIVEFEQIENFAEFPLSTEYEGEVQSTESISLKKKTLPHKEDWNRVEEGISATVSQTDEFKNVKYPAGSLLVDTGKQKEFLEQFNHKMFGLIEIFSQNSAAATFGENEMAAMFNTMTFTPFVNEEELDFEMTEVRFLVKPLDKKERNWKVVIVAEKANGPIFSLEMDCAVSTKEGLDKMLQLAQKQQTKEKEEQIVQETLYSASDSFRNATKFVNEQREKPLERMPDKEEMEPLETMPSKEEMKQGLAELIDGDVARKLNEANSEQGVYFDTVEINCQGKEDHRENNFIKGLSILREKTFRKTGEGTGKSSDWDSIDEHVRQTITWDPEEKMIVSGSRMAVPRETIEKETFFKNLYDTSEEFEKNISEKSAELGRTFLNAEYLQYLRKEKKGNKMRPAANSIFTGVLKQFDTLLKEGHKLEYMHGAVSIDGRYSKESLRRYAGLYTYFFPADKMFDSSQVKQKEGIQGVEATISKFEDENKGDDKKWVDLESFSKSEKQLKIFLSEEATKTRAQHPALLGRYPTFVGNQEGACSYFNPVINTEREGCMEIGLLLDMSQVPYEVEQKYSLKGKDLKKEESVAAKVAHF